jgi:hypothetical protein
MRTKTRMPDDYDLNQTEVNSVVDSAENNDEDVFGDTDVQPSDEDG